MYNCHIEMPSGCVSRGYDRPDEKKAKDVFRQMFSQIASWERFAADVVMSDDGVELQRARVSNNA